MHFLAAGRGQGSGICNVENAELSVMGASCQRA